MAKECLCLIKYDSTSIIERFPSNLKYARVYYLNSTLNRLCMQIFTTFMVDNGMIYNKILSLVAAPTGTGDREENGSSYIS